MHLDELEAEAEGHRGRGDRVSQLADVRRRAHRIHLLGPYAGAWLHAIPSFRLRTALSSRAFLHAVLRRLNLPVYSQVAIPYPCPICNHPDRLIHPDGHHALGTCAHGGDKSRRHNAIRDLLAVELRNAGMDAVTEQRIVPGADHRDGDIVVSPSVQHWHPHEEGEARRQAAARDVVDVAVTHAGRNDQARSNAANAGVQPGRRNGSPRYGTPTYFADEYARRHKEQHRGRVEAAGPYRYVPLVASSLGVWSREAMSFLHGVIKAADHRRLGYAVPVPEVQSPEGTNVHRGRHSMLLTRLSVVIMQHGSWMIDRRRSPGAIADLQAALQQEGGGVRALAG